MPGRKSGDMKADVRATRFSAGRARRAGEYHAFFDAAAEQVQAVDQRSTVMAHHGARAGNRQGSCGQNRMLGCPVTRRCRNHRRGGVSAASQPN
jgi:hypothetical protein